MKVLLFSTYDGAFLERIVYEGLCGQIGANNVYLYKPDDVEFAVDKKLNGIDKSTKSRNRKIFEDYFSREATLPKIKEMSDSISQKTATS